MLNTYRCINIIKWLFVKRIDRITNMNSAITLFGLMTILCMGAMVAFAAAPAVDMGCFIIGTEINGDNSVEYLGIGDC
jgi:hypothetical protein